MNPPNGSWGIVKVQPPSDSGDHLSPTLGRSNLNHPPTAVGGIQAKAPLFCRSDLNHPPTAVGGIRERGFLWISISLPYIFRAIASLAAAFCFILIASFITNAAAEEKPLLELNRAIEKSFAGGATHGYRVGVTAGQYLRITVDQRGIDIAIKIIAPDGKELVTSDLSDKGDIDSAVWIAEAAGEYRIDIAAAKAAPRGAYRIELVELRAPNEQDRQRVAAQQSFLEAEKFFAENKPDLRRKAMEQYEQAMRLWRGVAEFVSPD